MPPAFLFLIPAMSNSCSEERFQPVLRRRLVTGARLIGPAFLTVNTLSPTFFSEAQLPALHPKFKPKKHPCAPNWPRDL